MHTRRTLCEHEGRGKGGASASQGAAGIPSTRQQPEERVEQILPHHLQKEPALSTPGPGTSRLSPQTGENRAAGSAPSPWGFAMESDRGSPGFPPLGSGLSVGAPSGSEAL